MRYVTWAAFYEGPTDALYFDILLPRIIRDVVVREGNHDVEIPDTPALKLRAAGRSIQKVAEEACASKDAYHIIFIHADAGGRGLVQGLADRADAYCTAMAARCAWPSDQCITITPRHETEHG